ncbi:metallophosphoesterase family protein [Chryseobacterium indoltheticum]|uniref:Uncharacterized protein conserved in bacteria n=1 Tax=Chryseobacterium indoltheticum TaxID=254 RepID=A0A381FPY0_9FLAO|nr:metallophosphoesterase [Chryseobacterium indoltheticum]SUX48553.1 Uncharacterized protein conserved in bacteria [Chryseobacterium indoltheticum]
MRIVHISDIHLSKDNFAEFENNYLEALLNILSDENKKIPIDVIVITGDLVDQGGHSLFKIEKFKGKKDPFEIFEEEFITPIKMKLNFSNSKFLFIAGNHDVDENEILWVHEKKLQDDEIGGCIDQMLQKNKSEFSEFNKRIELFKNFELRFHEKTTQYNFSNNESTFIYETPAGVKVGFALINDSWRCSTCALQKYQDKKLYFGEQQLYQALQTISEHKTVMNVILTHHPIVTYAEEEDVFRALAHKDYHLHLFGDKHHQTYASHITPTGNCFGIMARAALNKPTESDSKWQPGFHIIDIDFSEAIVQEITYYKYIHSSCVFGKDTDTAPPDGCDRTGHKLGFNKILKERKVKQSDLDRSKYYRQ